MSEDRELVERFAAIDATPDAGWVAELRADLDAAWDTGEVPGRHAPPLARPRQSPTRIWLVASISAAAVAILVVALVVLPRNRDDVQTPSNTPAPVATNPTPTTTPGTTTPTTPTTTTASSSTVPPAPGTVVVTSAGRIDQTARNGSFVFNAGGSTLALAGDGYGLRLYDPDTLALERELECPTTPVQAPDITSFTWNQQVAATWDAESRTLLTDLIWANHPAGCQVVFSADGSRAARGEEYGTYDKMLDVGTLLWDTTDGSLIGALEGGSPRFSLDGTRIITRVMGTGGAKVWDAATGQPVEEFDIGQVFAPPLLSGNRTRILVGGQLSGTVLDARTLEPVADVSFPEQSSMGPTAINHDGTLIASTDGTTVSVWDVATGALVQSLTMKSPAVGGIAFNPNGTQILLGEFESASVWDVATGEEVFRIDASATPPTFSPDGALLAIATLGSEPTFFDTTTGEQLNQSESSVSPFGFIAFSPDGRTLAVNSESSVDLWTYART